MQPFDTSIATTAPIHSFATSRGRQAVLLLAGTMILTLSAYISVPMIPVPITMQTLAVTLIGAFYGKRLGTLTVCAWLLEGMLGLPVFAGGTGGPVHFFGPTGGYLMAYPVMAYACALVVARGWDGRRPLRAFAGLLLASGICLGIGWAWLSMFLGAKPAFMAGVWPFIIGDLVKTAMAVLALVTWHKIATRRVHGTDA